MAHMDEGTLHALLDGALRAMEPERAEAVQAHLESCAECRARAEEAARLRGRTDEILGVLEPSVTPDFEEVLVRAGARGRAPTSGLLRQHRWTRGLAWAATIVIALGTGYLIRDQVVPGPAAEVTSSEAADRAAGPRQAADGGGADAGAGLTEPQADLPRTASEEPEALESDRRAPTESDRRELAESERPGPMAPERSEPSLAASDRPPAQEQARRQPQEPAEEERQDPQEPPVAADVAAQEPLEMEELRVDAARMAMQSRERLEAARLARASERQAPAQSTDVLVLPGDTLASFRDAEPGAVAALAGAPLMVLPGAEVLRAQVGQGDGDAVIVSVQRLEGLELRVTQRPVSIALDAIVVTGVSEADAAEPAAAAAAEKAENAAPLGDPVAPEALRPTPEAEGEIVSRVRVPSSFGWELVVEGALPPEALEALGRAARPYQPPPGQR